MRRDQHRPAPGISVLIGADHRLDELTANDGIESRCWFVEHQELGLWTDGTNERQLRALPFREVARFLLRVESKLLQQRGFGLYVPVPSKRREVAERVLHGHPRIERDNIREVGDARLHGDLVSNRIKTKDPRSATGRTNQVQEALDRRRFPGAVAAKQAVTAAGGNAQVEPIDGVGPAVAADEVVNLDRGCVIGHDESRVRGTRSLLFKCVESLFAKAQELALVELEVMRVHHRFVDRFREKLPPDIFFVR